MGAEGVPQNFNELVGYAEVGRIVGARPRTIRRWVRAGVFPPPVVLGQGGLARWRVGDVYAHVAGLKARVVTPATK